MKLIEYSGLLSLHSYGESEDVLFLSTLGNPLADELADEISEKTVTVRYWITDTETTKEEATEEFMAMLMGSAFARFQAYYSEITGYLWTDEDLTIGGHDLMDELKSSAGKWLILEIEVQP